MFKTLFSILFIFLLACSPSEEVSSQNTGVNMETPEGAFLQILSHADNNDFNSFKNAVSNPVYLQKKVEELNILDVNAANQFKESVLRKFQGLEVTITSEITNNEAILTVSAIKNDQQKKDKFIYMIKDISWKLNLFGFNHDTELINSDRDTCSVACYPSWFDKTTSSCYCWDEEPLDRDISDIFVQYCEDHEHPPSCYKSYARSSLNLDYCWKVPDYDRGACFSAVAARSGDYSICDYLWDDVNCQNV
jgi:hypothetical protein